MAREVDTMRGEHRDIEEHIVSDDDTILSDKLPHSFAHTLP